MTSNSGNTSAAGRSGSGTDGLITFSARAIGGVARARSGAKPLGGALRSAPEARAAAIGRLPLLQGSTEEDVSILARASRTQLLPRGACLPRATLRDVCVFLTGGLAKTVVSREDVDGELVLDVHGAGDLVSEAWRGEDSSEFVVAVEDSSALLIAYRELEDVWAGNTTLAKRFLQWSSRRHARLSAFAVQNACLDVGERLYCRLAELAHRHGRVTPEGLVVDHGLTQREVADFAFASRENVNRQLGKWQDNGWIGVRRRSIVILNSEALSRSVSPMARRVGLGVGDGRCALVEA